MSNSFQFHITTFSTPSLKVIFDFKLFCQEPKQPKVTRQSQIECRPAAPGRGKGRGRGPGRGGGNKSKQGKDAWDDGTWDDWMEDDWDPNWKWSAGQGWYWDDKVATKKKEPNEPKPKRARKAERKTHDSGEAGSSKPDKTPAAKASRKRQNSDSEEKKPAKSKRSTTEAEKEEDVEPKTKKEDVEPKTGKKRIGEEAGETQKCEGQQKKCSGSRTRSRSSIHIERAKERNLRFLEYGQKFDWWECKGKLAKRSAQLPSPGMWPCFQCLLGAERNQGNWVWCEIKKGKQGRRFLWLQEHVWFLDLRHCCSHQVGAALRNFHALWYHGRMCYFDVCFWTTISVV